jgi:hypothetical protein
MEADPETVKSGRWARWRERRQDRRQKRAWRRERQKGTIDPAAASIRGQQHVHGQALGGGPGQGSDGSSGS